MCWTFFCLLASDFRVFDNYFDLPVAAVCACVVDVIDQKVCNMS